MVGENTDMNNWIAPKSDRTKLVVWFGTYRYHVKRSYMYIYGKKGGNARHRPFMGASVSFFIY